MWGCLLRSTCSKLKMVNLCSHTAGLLGFSHSFRKMKNAALTSFGRGADNSLSWFRIQVICSWHSNIWNKKNPQQKIQDQNHQEENQEIPLVTLQGTNISSKNGILKKIFLFPRRDMLIPWRLSQTWSLKLLRSWGLSPGAGYGPAS